MTDDAIFPYVDAIPVKGCWVGLDEDTCWADIAQALVAAGYTPDDEILVACADGLAAKFLSPCDAFDLAGYRACAAAEGDAVAKAAFIDHFGEWDAEAFEEALVQAADSEVQFTQDWFDEVHGQAILQAEQTGLQIDWEATAVALFAGDFYFDDGYVFRRV